MKQEQHPCQNTFNELLNLGAVPIVNENDTVSTYEIKQVQTFGDNDRLSAIVTSIIDADLLILLSDIDGLYTDDPNSNPDARFINQVDVIDDKLLNMGKSTSGSGVGTGGIPYKLYVHQHLPLAYEFDKVKILVFTAYKKCTDICT